MLQKIFDGSYRVTDTTECLFNLRNINLPPKTLKGKKAHLISCLKRSEFLAKRMNETGHHPHLIYMALFYQPLANGYMTNVRRVKRASKKTDSFWQFLLLSPSFVRRG